jgi:hypothetical protein
MKKSPFPLLIIVVVLFGLLWGCKKDGITPETSFIEFTIDGTEYRINSTNTTLEGSHSGQYVVLPPSHILTTVFSSSTNDEVAKVGTASGDSFEGTFQFSNLEYKDDQQQVISTGHTLTNGSFRVFLD